MGKQIKKVKAYINRYGIKELLRKYIEKKLYDESKDYYTVEDEDIECVYQPCISVLIPVFNPERQAFCDALLSVKNQTYQNYQVCISDAGTQKMKDFVKEVFGDDERVVYIAHDEPKGISDNSNAALELATGEYIALFDHDDLLEPNALMEVVKVINRDDSPDMIYTDEDKVSADGKRFFEPYRKPDYNRPLLLANNYICHFTVIKKTKYDEVGGFRKEFDGAQDYDLFLRVAASVDKMGEPLRISHICKILYHWRAGENSTSDNPFNKGYAFDAGRRALESFLKDNYPRYKTSVEELSDPGFYKINILDYEDSDIGYYPTDTMGNDEFNELQSYACVYGGDVIVPKTVWHGKYRYNGVAKKGDRTTQSLVGKPQWYRGRFNLGNLPMESCVPPANCYMISKKCGKDHTLEGLKIVYVPFVVCKVRRNQWKRPV